MNKIEKIKELVQELNKYSFEYYVLDKPSISDKQYDAKYDELLKLEKEENYILSNSPTQKVQGEVLPFLKKVTHTEPMLSADKSKDINDIISFMGNEECLLSWKLDGLTIVLRYNEGKFQQAITRGGGIEGEDVTHAVRTFSNVPMSIPYKGYLEIRGEGLLPFDEFNKINEQLLLKGEETYASPRNLSAGSVRQLDANITKSRNLIFLAFGIVKCDNFIAYKDLQFDFLTSLGFEVVYHEKVNKNTITECVEKFKAMIPDLPFLTDGLIIEFNDIIFGNAQGVTGHHSKNMIAMKHSDSSYETIFRGIELNTTRTGMVSITALFDSVDIDGVSVSRASLHNYDIFKEFELGIGDTITVYRANSVIPQIEENLTRSNTYELDMKCPSCGRDIVIKTPKNASFLFCENDDCPSKLIQKFTHFVSKNCMNIDGLSEATLEKFIDKGFLKRLPDIYKLDQYKKEIVNMSGMGLKSYNNLIKSIEKSKQCKLENFLVAIGVPNVGVGTAKLLVNKFKTIQEFINAKNSEIMSIEGIGDVTTEEILAYRIEHLDLILDLIDCVEFIQEEKKVDNSLKDLTGMTFVITGSVHTFKNRDEFKILVQGLNGKVASAVSSKTNYLVNNDILSTTGKNQKAQELNIPIINEESFNEMIGRIV